jgi:hypothetical protein
MRLVWPGQARAYSDGRGEPRGWFGVGARTTNDGDAPAKKRPAERAEGSGDLAIYICGAARGHVGVELAAAAAAVSRAGCGGRLRVHGSARLRHRRASA